MKEVLGPGSKILATQDFTQMTMSQFQLSYAPLGSPIAVISWALKLEKHSFMVSYKRVKSRT